MVIVVGSELAVIVTGTPELGWTVTMLKLLLMMEAVSVPVIVTGGIVSIVSVVKFCGD